MNLNLFRYIIRLPSGIETVKALHERQCKCMEKSSIYNKQKDQKKGNKKDVYLQTDNIISEWISLSDNKENFVGMEQIGIPDKLKLPYEGRQLFTRWTHSYPNSNEIKSKTLYIKYEKKLSMINKPAPC